MDQTEKTEGIKQDNVCQQKADKRNHWQLLRDLFGFQFKLFLDAIRDLLLSPVSVVMVLFGIITDKNDPGKYYRSLMDWGRRSDHWINLFDQHNDGETSDEYVQKMQDIVVREYEKGGVVSKVKNRADGLVGNMQSISKSRSGRANTNDGTSKQD